MEKSISDLKMSNIARIAGLGYLIIFFSGIFSNFFVLEALVLPQNALITVENIRSNEMLFRIGIFGFIIMVVFDAVLTWALYILFRPVNQILSILAAWLRLINCAVFAMALFHLFSVLQLLSGAEYLGALGEGRIEAEVMLSLGAFNYTWLVGLIFFGLHLAVLGYLILRSAIVPRLLGILLTAAALGYLVDSSANVLLVDYMQYKDLFSLIVVVPGVIGELSFSLWLLFKGVTLSEPIRS